MNPNDPAGTPPAEPPMGGDTSAQGGMGGGDQGMGSPTPPADGGTGMPPAGGDGGTPPAQPWTPPAEGGDQGGTPPTPGA